METNKLKTGLKEIYIVILFMVILFNPLAAQVSQDSINEYLSAFKDDFDLASLTVAFINKEGIVWEGAFGKANIEKDIDISATQLQTLGSISKLFTGAALLKLYEEGKLSLDDDVNNYLPFAVRNPKFPDVPITFRMLLTHSSGIGDYQELQDSLYNTGDPTMSLAEVTNKFFNNQGEFYRPENFMDFEPGAGWKYSNWNFVLIGYLIERISGRSFNEYNKEEILEPLEMNTAGWFFKDIDTSNLVTLYRKNQLNEKRPLTPFSWPGYSDGSLHASVDELSNFLIMILNKGKFKGVQVLKEETINEMLQPQAIKNLPAGWMIDMGLVWHIAQLSDTLYFHGGEPIGNYMLIGFIPNTESGFISCITGIKFGPDVYPKWVNYIQYLVDKSDAID